MRKHRNGQALTQWEERGAKQDGKRLGFWEEAKTSEKSQETGRGQGHLRMWVLYCATTV